MGSNCLTVELVEKLQISLDKGKPVSDIINQLENATLPGLVEYGCLRFAFPNRFPSVPKRIMDSPLGVALTDVRSAIGIRQDGPQRGPVKSLQPNPIEFFVVDSEEELNSTGWENLCHRFELGAKQAGFAKATAINLHFALYEMASNAVIHADAPTAPLIGYQILDGKVLFTVADVGIGILESLRTSDRYGHLSRAVDAVQYALRPGVTRLGRGGLGFNQVFKAVASDFGELRFRSGSGCITMRGTDLDHDCDSVIRSYPPALPGFQVSMCCRACTLDANGPAF